MTVHRLVWPSISTSATVWSKRLYERFPVTAIRSPATLFLLNHQTLQGPHDPIRHTPDHGEHFADDGAG